MAHYARVNSENIVTYVTPIPNEMITDENGVEHEEWALTHLYSTIPDSVNDRWIQTSYNNNFRKRYAGLGYTWDEVRNAFIPPKPYASWTFDEQTLDWEPPIPMPQISDPPDSNGPFYIWNEEIGNWQSVYY
jgi:hypothetical protein